MSYTQDATIVWLTWRQLFAKKRLPLAIAFSLLPVLFTFFLRFSMSDREGAVVELFSGINRNLVIGTIVPLAAAVFGTTAFGGEVDDGTLLYLLVKPLPRWRVVLWKYVVAVVSTLCVMLPSMLLPWLILRGEEVNGSMLIGFLVGGTLGAAVYCAIFIVLGLSSRRSLVFALLYVIGFEAVLARNLVGVKSLSVREFAVSTSLRASSGTLAMADYVVPMSTVYTMAPIILLGAIGLCLWRLKHYEVAEQL
jgi:ABC-2 type transport system permease protein